MDSGEMQRARRLEIGERIKLARLTMVLSRAQLGKQLGISERAVESWESGERSPADRIGIVARVLRTTPEWLLNGGPMVVYAPPDEMLLRIVETLGDTYRSRKAQLDRIEKALYESALRELAHRALPPLQAQEVIAEFDGELETLRQRAAEARAARLKSQSGNGQESAA